MWWGYSQPLDLRQEIREKEDEDPTIPLEVFIVGSGDARHVIKTFASAYKHRRRRINFHVTEPFLEQVARSILFLSITLEEGLGTQAATRYYLELMGNTLLRPATAKYLVQRVRNLIDISTQSVECPWVNLEKLKHKDRDILESIFKFWERATCEGIPIVEYWDRRIRKALDLRYDYREGVFDWDYHMVLKSRENTNLTLYEYRFWRSNGIAFTWMEGEPARCNPTLINDIENHGKGFLHRAYMGDINVGPYFTWSLETDKRTEKLRATDVAERGVMRAIHEIRTNKPMCDEAAAAHRDPSLLNAIIVTEMPNNEVEHETWSMDEKFKRGGQNTTWTNIPDFQAISSVTNLTFPGCREIIGQAFTLKGVPQESIPIVMASISEGTINQYRKPLSLWWDFCQKKRINPFQAPVGGVLEFLTVSLSHVKTYGTLNSYRSALALIVIGDIGQQPVIKRFFRGVAHLRPQSAKYDEIWDPDPVLCYLKTLWPHDTLSFVDLTKKLVMLLALVTAQRVQTLSKIRLSCIEKTDTEIKELR